MGGDDAAPAAKRARDAAGALRLAWADEPSALQEAASAFAAAAPFPHWALEDALEPSMLEELQAEISKHMEFVVKDNDLFSFLQTPDLSGCTSPLVQRVVEALYSDKFRGVIETVTGTKGLTSKIDLTSSVYAYTNNLLCHDDELSSRRIAFIFYLVPEDWSEADGGTLDLFTVDANKQPIGIYKRIVPKRNTLMLFEVSDRSYHQVAEVLSRDKVRHSIGGWFHGPPAATPDAWKPIEPTLGAVEIFAEPAKAAPLQLEGDDAVDLGDWVTASYFAPGTQKMVCAQFESESCVQLHEFLRPDKVAALKAALGAAEWKPVGPYQMRRFDVLSQSAELQRVVQVFQSAPMAELIAKLTGLENGECSALMRRFTAGCYSLIHDLSDEEKASRKNEVDAVWTFVESEDKWGDEEQPTGGDMVYAADGEPEPILVAPPQPNVLTIVYRSDPGHQSFVKFVNSAAPSPLIDVTLTYAVKDDEEEGSDK